MRKYWGLVTILVVTVVLILVRVTAYEPLGESIATYDTPGFIESGHLPFPSAEFFLSNRPATISFMYKVLEPASGYELTAFSSPAEDIYSPPALQPGLDRVAIFQGVLSIIAWTLLAFTVARRLRNIGLQILATVLILAFGFSPTITEWDAVLLSEPMSLSLFVILFAFSIEIVPRLVREQPLSALTKVWVGPWYVVLVLWVFARDTNAYMLLLIIGLAALLIILRWRTKLLSTLSMISLVINSVLLLALFLVHNLTLQQSGRWINPFFNNVLHNVLPYPEHQAFFEHKGMPITKEVLALRFSPGNEDRFFEIPELMAWTEEYGASTYMQFLLAFPGWTMEKFLAGVETSFSENRQPFFEPNEERTTPLIAYIGNLLHPNSSTVIWVVFIELVIFGVVAFRKREQQSISLALLFATYFAGEVLMLFVSIHGDALGIVRHGMGSVMPLRLAVWLLPPFILDISDSNRQESQKIKKTSQKKGH
jgi:hypothetical protein